MVSALALQVNVNLHSKFQPPSFTHSKDVIADPKFKNLAPCGTNGRLLLSGFQLVVTLTLTLDRVIRHTIVHHSSTSIYIPSFIEIGKNFFAGTAPSLRSRDTKLGQISKIRPDQI